MNTPEKTGGRATRGRLLLTIHYPNSELALVRNSWNGQGLLDLELYTTPAGADTHRAFTGSKDAIMRKALNLARGRGRHD